MSRLRWIDENGAPGGCWIGRFAVYVGAVIYVEVDD